MITYKNGIKTELNFFEDTVIGFATIIHPNGKKWTVEYKNGKMNGKGYSENPTTGSTYEGNFVEGKFFGKGIHRFKDGSFTINDIQKTSRSFHLNVNQDRFYQISY